MSRILATGLAWSACAVVVTVVTLMGATPAVTILTGAGWAACATVLMAKGKHGAATPPPSPTPAALPPSTTDDILVLRPLLRAIAPHVTELSHLPLAIVGVSESTVTQTAANLGPIVSAHYHETTLTLTASNARSVTVATAGAVPCVPITVIGPRLQWLLAPAFGLHGALHTDDVTPGACLFIELTLPQDDARDIVQRHGPGFFARVVVVLQPGEAVQWAKGAWFDAVLVTPATPADVMRTLMA